MNYLIAEIFGSLQGEGRWTGRPATFIRFATCNLKCAWCDTPRQAAGKSTTLASVLKKVEDFGNGSVVVTGGEPTIQTDLGVLVKALKARGLWVALETNGLVDVPELALFDYVAASPKAAFSARYLAGRHLTRADEVRIVAESESIADFCRAIRKRIQAENWYVSPLDDGKGRIHYRRAFNLLRKLNRHLDPGEPPWMLSIQTHKVLGLR